MVMILCSYISITNYNCYKQGPYLASLGQVEMSSLQFCNRANSAFVHLYVVRVHLSSLVFNIIEWSMSNGFVPGVPSLDSPNEGLHGRSCHLWPIFMCAIG
jgi:hypothetical protein